MNDSELSKSSSEFVEAFSELSKRLAKISVWIDQMNLSYGGFGCWELIARKGDEAVRFFYDGRDKYIEVETSPAPLFKNSSARKWTKTEAKALDRSEAIPYAENFLMEAFGTNATLRTPLIP